ncbi:MAG: tetratricopeptide repeat protein, partial [Verrucomicrobiota bacterium]
MTIRRFFLLLPLLALISCDKDDPRYEAEDERNPFFEEAQKAVHDRDYEKAVKSYEAALRKNPKAAAAHYEIGMLYSEKLGDPIKTIYHLQRFLEERPNTDKAEMAKGHLDNAKITFAATLPNSPVQNAELFA